MNTEDLKLVHESDPILREELPELADFDDAVSIRDRMYHIVDTLDALGLAANQIGLKHRMFVMNINNTKKLCINPVVVKQSSEEKVYQEGCLSFPALFLYVKRPLWVLTKYQTIDVNGHVSEVSEKMHDLYAQCYCHELDHLNGIVFTNRVSNYKLKRAKDKQKKWIRKQQKSLLSK